MLLKIRWYDTRSLLLMVFFQLVIGVPAVGYSAHLVRKAKDTLTPVELHLGDTLTFVLRNGQSRTLVLKETEARVVITNLKELKTSQRHGATLYLMSCKVEVDGHDMDMVRYVGSQESFYEPYVINGMRIWFDGIAKMTDILIDRHGGKVSGSKPNKDVRFVVTDMLDDICPIELHPLYDNPANIINIADVYNGDDCWMGAFDGFEAHGGLDINQHPGTPNYVPFPIDDHSLFNSLAQGHDNNRWRGHHQWENGDRWTLQNHHVLNLRVPEHTSMPQGTRYAEAAGVLPGAIHHSHYVLRVKTTEDESEILIDPWILFWQIFEQGRRRQGELKAMCAPFRPGTTNTPIRFLNKTFTGNTDRICSYYWTFGDGGFSMEKHPEYVFSRSGIYPVTLVVDDGVSRSQFTQHISIDGPQMETPVPALAAEREPAFRVRKLEEMDVYGSPVRLLPRTLFFLGRATRPRPAAKTIDIENLGAGRLPDLERPAIDYESAAGWLYATVSGEGNQQQVSISVDATGLPTGTYKAVVSLTFPGCANAVQRIPVKLVIPTHPPAHAQMRNLGREIIDNEDIRYQRFYCTPYFWVGPRFSRWKAKGYRDFYLTNGGRAEAGEYVRFRPDLEAGTYALFFVPQTPFDPQQRAMDGDRPMPVNPVLNPEPSFLVRVHDGTGDTIIRVEPAKDRRIGVFRFEEGMDGYVDLLAEGSIGQVLADAIIFEQVEE